MQRADEHDEHVFRGLPGPWVLEYGAVTIVYYVSGHGLGHAARAAEVMKQLPHALPLVIKSEAPRWFFSNELSRPFEQLAQAEDAGPVQHGALSIDLEATLARNLELLQEQEQRLHAEADWLASVGARVVVSDIPAFPLRAARLSGIPSVAIASFTWADIFRPYTDRFPEFGKLCATLEQHYSEASVALVAGIALPMSYFTRRTDIPLIARRGQTHRTEIASATGLNSGQPWFLIYPGGHGIPINYQKLSELKDYAFLSFAELPKGLPNVNQLDRERFWQADVIASVNGVVTKPGYMTLGECLSTGTPILYTDRDDFAEDRLLIEAARTRNAAIHIERSQFQAGEWGPKLQQLMKLNPTPLSDTEISGAAHAARIIANQSGYYS